MKILSWGGNFKTDRLVGASSNRCRSVFLMENCLYGICLHFKIIEEVTRALLSTDWKICILYSEKFSRGANLRFSRAARAVKHKNSNWEKLPRTRISHAELVVNVVSRHWNINITTTNISSEGLSAKICTLNNFLLYGISETWSGFKWSMVELTVLELFLNNQ